MKARINIGSWLLAILLFTVAAVSAYDPPHIVEKPKDLKVKYGSIATFYCRVTGDPTPEVTWRRNGKKLSNVHSRISIQNFPNGVSMLRIEPVRYERDDASYECSAENGVADPVTASANLTVYGEPDIPPGFPTVLEPPMKTKTVEKGRNAQLRCRVTGAPPLTIIWIKDLLPIQPSDRFVVKGENGDVLQIKDATESDQGTYECVVKNYLGTDTSASGRLHVKERRVPPDFSIPPKPLYEVMRGENVNITCVAVGSPMPTVRWRKGVVDLNPPNAIPIGRNVLYLRDIQETATYTCTATSMLGIKEINSTVKVQSLPKPPSNLRVSDVTASSVRLSWSYSKGEEEDVTYYVVQYKPKFSNQDYAEISGVLNEDHMIGSLNPYTEYEFSVIAFNKVGRGKPSDKVYATTGETQPKSAPKNVNARPLSSSQMLLSWEEPESPNGQIIGYKVYYTTNPTLPLAQWDSDQVESNAMKTIHNLIPRTIYTLKVQAYTAIGPGPASQPIQAKTEQGVPGQPKDFRVSQITSNSVMLQWKRPSHIGDSIVGYELYWNDTFSKERNHRSIPVVEQFILTGLYPNTMYFMWISAKSRKGEGAPTPPIPVRTEQFTPGAPPQKFRVEAEDSTSIRVSWSPPPEDKQHGDIQYYKIYFVEALEADALTKDVTLTDPTMREYVVDQLKKWTEYKFWLLAGTSVGDGPSTSPVLIRTQEDVPGEPKGVKAMALNSTTILVRWQSPSKNEKHGVIRGYQIHVQELANDGDDLLNYPLRFEVLDGYARSYNVSGLQPDTKYAVQVAALTRKGDGIRSKKVILRTPGGVPSRPDMTVKVLTRENSVTVDLEWSKPAQTFGTLQGYRLRYGRKGEMLEEVRLEGDKNHHHRITKLVRGMEYEFRVAGSNHLGYGQEAVKYVTTPEGAPTGPPINVTHRFQTADIVAISWNLPKSTERNGQILRYHVVFHRRNGVSTVRNVTKTKAVFVGLEENQEYWVQICAATSQGKGPNTEKYSIKTERDMMRPPTSVRAMATSDSTAEVWWEGVPARGRLVGYQVFYTTTAVEDLDTWQSISVAVTTSADLINLEKNSQYAVAVAAKTKAGLGRLSQIVDNVKIKPEVVPLQLTAVELSTHSMTLRWAPPVRTNPIEYKVRYDALKEFVDSDGMTQSQKFPPKEITVLPDKESVTVNELSPFTTYNVNVTGVPTDRSYRPPAKITVTTHMAAPQPMVKPDVCFHGGKIFLFLPQASEEYGPISHYYLVVVPILKRLSNKIPDQFHTDNMASTKGIRSKVTIVGSPYLNEVNVDDKDDPNLEPYVTARFLPRAIPRKFNLGDGRSYHGYDNMALQRGVKYKVFLRAVVDTPQKHLYTSSPFSDSLSLSMSEAPSCDPPSRPPLNGFSQNEHRFSIKHRVENMKILWIVGPSIAILVFVVCFLIACIFKRQRSVGKTVDQSGVLKPLMGTDGPDGPMPAGYITSSLGLHGMGSDGLNCNDVPNDPVEMRRVNFKSPAMAQHPPIPISDLAAHIDRLKANDNHLFSQEYESIDPGQQFTWESSSLDVNKSKNRYANVVAYDHSRVVLSPVDGIPGSDYINANYCDGYRRQNAYIATQGPLPETFADFWRMCWEVNTATIIMMTRLEERARVKCDQYWPTRGSESYGDITVTLTDVQELSFYCIRTFLVRKSAPGMQQTREIKQLQFTAWPDHGVPDHPAPFLIFLRRVKALNPLECGPMIAHCSAGVGRTGCFIVIDSMLERMKYDTTVDIYGHVTCLRAQRNYMVQTEDQYIFIHDAVLEAVMCGNTEAPVDKLQHHFEMLTSLPPGETYTGLNIEFKKLSNMKIDPTKFISANLPYNQRKNRLVNILPFESTRVCLQPIRGMDGSDYINASFISGYKDRCTYIATQGPLQDTVEDFWRMIWEHNSTIIVMLTKLREMGKEKCCHYWPSGRSQRYHCYVVDPIAEYNLPQYTLREFKVTDARDEQSRTIRQFQFAEWPEQGVPKSTEGFVDFIGQVHKTKEQFGQEGPITVHCSAGVARTGVFIALSIVLDRIQNEDVVDLFQTVRILRTQRPAMVQSEDQYEFCYRAALEYLAYDQYT